MDQNAWAGLVWGTNRTGLAWTSVAFVGTHPDLTPPGLGQCQLARWQG